MYLLFPLSDICNCILKGETMVTNDATLVHLKHKIMEEVAKLAWEGKLDEEHKEKLI